ncbi:MAG: hypothetical protein ACRDT5_09570 [Mycobacterium sp.]
MRKAIIAAAAAAIALAPISVAYSRADPIGDQCKQYAGDPVAASQCVIKLCGQMGGVAADECVITATVPTQAPITTPAQVNPSTTAASATTTPAQVNPSTTAAPITMPVQTPVTKPAVVPPPKGLDASPQAIAAAKAAPATQADPANPPPPPTQVDFNQRVQSVISTHDANIDVVNGLAYPRHWDYIDYDEYQHPILYNPINEAMTFRYFYGGDYREVYVAAASRVVLNVAGVGVFPFTAVGENYLTSGSFYGGSPPAVYHDVATYVPAYNQTVQVGKVQQVGHDDRQPAGSQDTFMLDDSTLARGQANNPSDSGQITVTKTQTLPGVGPTDDGKSLVDLAVAARHQPTHSWWLWLGAGALLIAVGLVAWMVTRPKEARTGSV